MSDTPTVSIRELSHETSGTLRRVKAGETIEITERGRVIGRIVPVGAAQSRREQLIAAGRLSAGNRDHRALFAAIDHRLSTEPIDQASSGTKAVLDMRDDERY
ncbi:type II toxin-antitoxin system Phd/YefM family antitoxin [Microlunatus soli]|uniref:Prevent-host-death family protein n=1 Tax=Microlunatus soli TaxID=630515 RepID=A0A1H2A386_9ACTN|nr:type II toxin-antitoxin system prevent-host-death family antitoxin [Microlunatus soli]SDT40394.1 prevent-host-death family protein [Microlunatus soli]